MFRNNLKIAFCGLIILSVFLVGGCSSTRPLLIENSSNERFYNNINIKSDPYAEYRIRSIIEKSLPFYVSNIEKYMINIDVKENSSSVVYTERQVAKEQLRISAKIEIYDKNYNKLSDKLVDAFSTYEVCDDLPFSVLASKKQARDSILNELANSIVLAVASVLK